MCGFFGCIVKREKLSSVLERSIELINHRGPDCAAYVCHKVHEHFLYLAHTRLSIIDLSDSASQPFKSSCGNYEIIFNGEIYNYKELKTDLIKLGYKFLTQSDTEVLLYAFKEWGEKCLSKLIGMFSFVFFDKINQTLTLVRDAFGIKPLFYSYQGKELYFANEIRSLINLKEEQAEPDLQSAYDYLVHGDYDSSQSTFVKGIKNLLPAHFVKFNLKDREAPEPIAWWKPNISTNSKINFKDAVIKLRNLFLESIQLHLRSDVPLGVALSGGVDSSAITSAIRYLEPDIKLKTFSYIDSDKNISEEYWMDIINQKMDSISNKAIVNEEKFLSKDLDDLILKQSEPFGGTSIYAQYKVFELAKQSGVKVILDGQGADELLAGYDSYVGYRMLSIVETDGWLSAHRFIKSWAKNSSGRSYFLAWKYFANIKLSDYFHKLVRKKMGRDFEPVWLNIEYLKRKKICFKQKRPKLKNYNKGQRLKEALSNALTNRGLQSLLRHADRNSMAFSIESRVPFLTIPLVEFLLSLPEHFLLSSEGITKSVFREAMRGIVPDSHLDRKDKIGFETSEYNWLFCSFEENTKLINDAPEINFINKREILKELKKLMYSAKTYDKRAWRWINYLRWLDLINIKSPI
jgi:asparagine synthase (glutamine-hydrolysing)